VKPRETFGGAEGDEVQTGSQASSWWLRRTVLYEGVAGDDHLSIWSVHVPREAKIAGCTRPRPCASSTASQTCSAHVFGPGVADRLRVEQVYRGGRSGGRVSDRLTAVTSHEQDKCFGMSARDV
jgi:hypothetical protein